MVNEGQIVFNPPPTCNIIEIMKAISDTYKKPFACILCVIYAAASWGMVLFGFCNYNSGSNGYFNAYEFVFYLAISQA